MTDLLNLIVWAWLICAIAGAIIMARDTKSIFQSIGAFCLGIFIGPFIFKVVSKKFRSSSPKYSKIMDLRIEDIEIHTGDISRPYRVIGKIHTAVRQGSKLSHLPTTEEANLKLREVASRDGINAVLNVKYKRQAGGFFIFGGHWLIVTGQGVFAEPSRIPCPHCAELIKREATKCRYCGSSFSDSTVVSDKSENRNRSDDIRKQNSAIRSTEATIQQIKCRCGAKLSVKRSLSGKTAKCPKCGHRFTIP